MPRLLLFRFVIVTGTCSVDYRFANGMDSNFAAEPVSQSTLPAGLFSAAKLFVEDIAVL